jgi:hypothetical protein
MKHATILLALVATIVGALVSAQAAYTDDGHRGRDGKNEQLVFVQTNELDGNPDRRLRTGARRQPGA